MIVGHADDAGVGDGDAMGVAAEIGQHLFWPAERRLRIDDPFGPPQVAEATSEGGGFRKFRKLAEESEFTGREGGSQLVEDVNRRGIRTPYSG